MWSLGADQQFTEIHRMGRCGLQWRSNGVGRVDKVRGPLSSRQNLKNNFPVTVTSGYQTLNVLLQHSQLRFKS